MLCCQDRVGLTHEQALYVLMKTMVQANIKRQKHQTSEKNVILISAKTISSNIISSIVSQKRNRLYDMFAMKVAFSDLYFVFLEFFR